MVCVVPRGPASEIIGQLLNFLSQVGQRGADGSIEVHDHVRPGALHGVSRGGGDDGGRGGLLDDQVHYFHLFDVRLRQAGES